MTKMEQSTGKDFFGNDINVGDVIIYSTGQKPSDHGMRYGVIDRLTKPYSNADYNSCWIAPIDFYVNFHGGAVGKVAKKASIYRQDRNVIKCPEEYVPDYEIRIVEKHAEVLSNE